MVTTVSLLMDLPPRQRFHLATVDAIRHAADHLGVDVRVDVVHTDRVDWLGHGVVIGPGSPYRDPAAAEDVIRMARTRGIPLVAT